MSWVNDLVSGLGLPAGGVTIATAMYAACVAAEKAARPEALQDIGRFLKGQAWRLSVRPSAIVSRVFKGTFGERHLSVKCGVRSVLASSVFVSSIILARYLDTGFLPGFRPTFWFFAIFAGWIPDYFALWKTRVLLNTSLSSIVMVIAAICASIAISIMGFVIVYVLHHSIFYFWYTDNYPPVKSLLMALGMVPSSLSNNIDAIVHLNYGDDGYMVYPTFFFSTLLTSIWTILIILSSMVLDILSPVQRFVAWFFDVEKRPIEAIGIVAGALAIIGSLVWSLARVVLLT
jgi:hypothetical protein